MVKRNPSLESLSYLVCRDHWNSALKSFGEDPDSVPQVEVMNPKLKEGIHYSVGSSNIVDLKPFMTSGQLLGSSEADGSLCIASNGHGDPRDESDDDDISIEHPPPSNDAIKASLNMNFITTVRKLTSLLKNTTYPQNKTHWNYNKTKIRTGAIYNVLVGNVLAWIIHEAMCHQDNCEIQVTKTSFSGSNSHRVDTFAKYKKCFVKMFCRELSLLRDKFGPPKISCQTLHSFRVAKRRVYGEHGFWKNKDKNDAGVYYRHMKIFKEINLDLDKLR